GSASVDAARVVDGRWLPDTAGVLPPMDLFAGLTSSVTIRMPEIPAIGIRVWGQQAITWQLSCSSDAVHFEHIGRVRTPDSAEPVPGDVYLRELSTCRQLRISPLVDGAWSLSELQLLVKASL